MSFTEATEFTGKVLDALGVAVLVLGTVWTVTGLAIAAARHRVRAEYRASRQRLGRAILLGLEILVAADIIRTVAIEPTLESVAVLAGIVLVRTFLSFSLEVELEGSFPWKRRAAAED